MMPPPHFPGMPPPPPMGFPMGPYMGGPPMPGMPMGAPPPPPQSGQPRIRSGEVLNGRIARFYPQKGYGFVAPDELDEDIFFLRSEMPQELSQLDRHEDVVGNRVSFEVRTMPDGKLRAQRMALLQDGSDGKRER